MKKLKIILSSNIFLIIIFLLTLLRILLCTNSKSIFTFSDNNFKCIVTNIYGNSFLLDCGEIIETKIEDDNINIGDIIKIEGTLSKYNHNTNFNLFDYKEYQNNRNIFYYLTISKVKKIGSSNNLLLNIKKNIYNRINSLKSKKYLSAFILGNKSEIDKESLKKLGIIHLFSISGMHISLFVNFIDNNVKKSKIKNIIIIIFLLLYYLLIESISLLRCIVFFIVKKCCDYLNLNLKKSKELLLSIMFIIIIKPKAIYDIGFYYSVILSCGIKIFNIKSKIKNKYLKKILLSIYIFLLSFPLNIYYSFEVNILSIVYNILFIPFVSFIFFPLSLITFIFPFLDNILMIIINLFEFLVSIFKHYDISFIFIKPNITMIVFYYIIIFFIIHNYKLIYVLFFLIIIHYNYNFLIKRTFITFLDVGQGDSFLIHINNNNILIDTGGNQKNNISDTIIIPELKSFGINKIDYLVLSHGDFDHMGEAINLVENFKVEKVIFNCGPYNDLEKDLIKVLNKKKIKYYSCIKELNIDKNKLYFLQTKEYDNENDNSNVIYTELNGYKFMFMGDASIITEKEILDKYNLTDIDVLKVGHHGSKTSSSKEFIDEIKPKYSVISVGKKNRYGHPNKEVLNNLNKSKIYRTDMDGSIMFKIKNNKLNIETCN